MRAKGFVYCRGSLCVSNLWEGVHEALSSCYTCRVMLGALIGTDRALEHSLTY